MAMPFLLIAAAVLAGSGQTSADPKAKDGIAAFFDLCGSTVTDLETPVEANRFRFTKLSSEFVARIRPMSKGQPFWDVQGIESGVRALAHIEANGVCALEIVEASEPQTRGRFDDQLQSVAERLGGVVQKQPDAVENDRGKPRTTSKWLLVTPNRSFLLGLTTYPDARYMTQHVALIRELR